MSLLSLPLVASLLVNAQPVPDAVGTVTPNVGNVCTATLIAPERALTAASCLTSDLLELAFGGERHTALAVHRSTSVDAAVIELATPSRVAPLPLVDGDALDRVTLVGGDGRPGAALLAAEPRYGLVLVGLVDGAGQDLAISDVLPLRAEAASAGAFSSPEETGEVLLGGALLVGLVLLWEEADLSEHFGCTAGGSPDPGLVLGALAALAVLASMRRSRAARA